MSDLGEETSITTGHAPAPAGATGQWRGRVALLATDGGRVSRAAARVVAALAEHAGMVPHVIHVFDTSPYGVPAVVAGAIAVADELMGDELHAEDVEKVRAQLRQALGRTPPWPVEIVPGTPSAQIARAAERTGAAVIVMGLRPHRAVDRLLREETTLEVMRRATCAVIGATPSLDGLPRRVLVAADFGRASVDAARAALEVLAPGGTLVLAHVDTPLGDEEDEATPIHALGVEAAFAQMTASLEPPAGVTIEHVVETGAPNARVGEVLSALADRAQADLVAAGARRHPWIERALLGSVTADLARAARHSLLVVPPPPRDATGRR